MKKNFKRTKFLEIREITENPICFPNFSVITEIHYGLYGTIPTNHNDPCRRCTTAYFRIVCMLCSSLSTSLQYTTISWTQAKWIGFLFIF